MINWSIAKVFIGDEKFSVGVCVNFIESVIAITLAGLYIPHISLLKILIHDNFNVPKIVFAVVFYSSICFEASTVQTLTEYSMQS